jgi:hypothetical protein
MFRSTDRDHAAERHRIGSWNSPVTLRRAEGRDGDELRRLAALDSRRLPPGPYLVAERDATIEAAISLSTGELLANPFIRTAEVATLLRCHAGGARVGPDREPARSPQRGVTTVRAKLAAT